MGAAPALAPGSSDLSSRIARFVAETVDPIAPAMARGEGLSPRQLVAAAGAAGLAGLLVPPAYGGSGAGHAAFVRFVEAVARSCASSSVILDVHVSVATEPLVRFGSAQQRRRFLPRLASGRWVGAFALTEPGSGSDSAALRTAARRDGAGWRLSGAKAFISNCGAADLYVVMARTGGGGASGITAFLVEAARDGVRPQPPLRKLGLHGSRTAELVLDDVLVPDENRLGGEGQGFRVAMAALDGGRIGISAQACGIGQGALDAAVLATRRGLSRAPARGGWALGGTDGAARWRLAGGVLADVEARLAAGRALTAHAAQTCDAAGPGAELGHAAAIAKLVATDACVEAAQASVEICAPDSADDAHPAAIRLRDAKACQIYEGTNQIQRVVIARRLLRDG